MNNIQLSEGEWIDDLQRGGLKIIQRKKGLRFGTDSVLLADFAAASPGDHVVDMGTGTGVIALLLAARHPEIKVTAVEIVPEIADMAGRSVAWNGMENRISVLNADVRNVWKQTGCEFADAVVSNPPYLQKGCGLVSPDPLRAAARGGEDSPEIEEWVCACAKLLKNGGKLFISFPACDIARLFRAMTDCRIEPKRMRGISVSSHEPAKRILVEGRKQGNPGLVFMPMLVTHNDDGSFSDEMNRIYGN